jgi:hypothetical protein
MSGPAVERRNEIRFAEQVGGYWGTVQNAIVAHDFFFKEK